jgi:hypothetical protein
MIRFFKNLLGITELEDRIDHIEVDLGLIERLIDENESLWNFIEEQKAAEAALSHPSPEIKDELLQLVVRITEPYGEG